MRKEEPELVAQETGSEVWCTEEENWKFHLSAFRERLIVASRGEPDVYACSFFLSYEKYDIDS